MLIVEQNSTGHRLFYARLLAEAAIEGGADVILLLGREGDRSAEVVHLASLPAGVEVLRDRRLSLSDIESLTVSRDIARTVIPDGDHFALALARRRAWNGAGRVSVLIMREHAQPRGAGVPARIVTRLKSTLRTFAFRKAAGMSGVDLRVLKSAGWAGESRFEAAIDPVRVSVERDSADRFRDAHAMVPSRYWFAVLGAISGRKNLDLVLEALEDVDSPWGILVAGIIDTDVPESVRVRLRRLETDGVSVLIDRLLTDAELDAAVAAADCIVLAHSNEGPSGLLGKAAAVGTRVVAAGATSLRQDLASLDGLGEWTELSAPSLAAAFSRGVILPRPAPLLTVESSQFTDTLL
ncbi:glycosyltransferase involved in cell wall biosynthesis [Curtobacterium herbarum]|uniref:hypothetical protein n=1 Tax=Curtobacterium herbarum TaxID=150122 RepID=UPI00209E311E|nr:hypothetical protein [Curtobacterium herbarum]MCP1504237.1 glycosyltransferase involved in cell wall biosynthesis [Curtobacterium herbarum]